MKIICIPYAGGSAMVYGNLKKLTNKSIEIVPVELSGRGMRLCEKLYDTFDEAVEDLYRCVKKLITDGDPYALFGHSMGSWLAFELGKKLFSDNEIYEKPMHIFFSGNYAPHSECKINGIANLSDADFWEYIFSKGGTSKEIFENNEYRELFTPILKSDFKIIEEYSNIKTVNQKLNCNITVLSGRSDEISEGELNEWSIYAGKGFNIKWFNGGHFYVSENPCEVSNYFNKIFDEIYVT